MRRGEESRAVLLVRLHGQQVEHQEADEDDPVVDVGPAVVVERGEQVLDGSRGVARGRDGAGAGGARAVRGSVDDDVVTARERASARASSLREPRAQQRTP